MGLDFTQSLSLAVGQGLQRSDSLGGALYAIGGGCQSLIAVGQFGSRSRSLCLGFLGSLLFGF
ncbi:MAG: hypothetical protein R3C56_23740 [Pirellulaceae bacterium]